MKDKRVSIPMTIDPTIFFNFFGFAIDNGF